MAGNRRVAFFLEDSAQEAIIPNLFRRFAAEEGYSLAHFDLQILNARGGTSMSAFRSFLKDARKLSHLKADLLIVGCDANCKGFNEQREIVVREAEKSPYQDFIAAIPDPHIERWYMLDLQALSAAALVTLSVSTPAYKCEKNRYKALLRQAFHGSKVTPALGGIEYGPLVAKTMNLYQAAKQDRGLAHFVEESRAWLKRQKTT